MDGTFLYLTTTGRNTGLPRTIEIWFVEHDGCAYVVAEHRERAQWVQNLVVSPECTFSIGTSQEREAVRPATPAAGRPIDPEREPELHEAVSRLMQEKYGWTDGLAVELRPTGD